jgi:PAS domain S-box-containing protein
MDSTPDTSAVKYQELFNNIPSGVAVYEAVDDAQDFIILDMNTAGETISKVKKEDIVGKRLLELFPGVIKMGLFQVMQEVYKTGNPKCLPTTLYEDDRLTQWVENNVYKLPSGHVVAVYVDVTEQKKAEHGLNEKQKFLDAIIENIPDMIFVKEAEDLRFTLFNNAGEKLLGQKREDLIGKNDHDFFPKDQADFFIKKDQETLSEGKLVDIPEEPITTPSGVRYLHTKKVPILNEDGKPVYLLGISEDITEKKQAGENLKKHVSELERFQKLSVDRELRMIELKKRIKELEGELGKK